MLEFKCKEIKLQNVIEIRQLHKLLTEKDQSLRRIQEEKERLEMELREIISQGNNEIGQLQRVLIEMDETHDHIQEEKERLELELREERKLLVLLNRDVIQLRKKNMMLEVELEELKVRLTKKDERMEEMEKLN